MPWLLLLISLLPIVAANPPASKRGKPTARHGAVVDDRGDRHILETDAERLEQSDVIFAARSARPSDDFVQRFHLVPVEPAGLGEIDELARFRLGLLDIVSHQKRGA